LDPVETESIVPPTRQPRSNWRHRRIGVARAAREFPGIFEALAEDRLNLSGVSLLVRHLRPENAAELLKAAEGRTIVEIRQLLAARFPRTEQLPMVVATSRNATEHEPVSKRVDVENSVAAHDGQPVAQRADVSNSARAKGKVRPKVASIAHDRFELHFSIGDRAAASAPASHQQ